MVCTGKRINYNLSFIISLVLQVKPDDWFCKDGVKKGAVKQNGEEGEDHAEKRGGKVHHAGDKGRIYGRT